MSVYTNMKIFILEGFQIISSGFFNMDYYFTLTLTVLEKLMNKNATKNYSSGFLLSHILKIAAFPFVGMQWHSAIAHAHNCLAVGFVKQE